MKARLGALAALAVALAIGLAGCPSGPATPELHVLNWSDYFAKETIARFEREHGCRVKLDYVVSTEDLMTKVERPPSGYDVIFPSDDIVPRLIAGGLVEKLDHGKIPNIAKLKPRFRGLPYDPENAHSVVYLWGTTGIAYDSRKVDPAPDSWAVLWDPAVAHPTTLLDEPRDVFAAALMLTGCVDLDRPTADELARAKEKIASKPPLAYTSSPKDKLITGDAAIAHCFNGDALQAAEALDGAIRYVIPKEGGILWIDNMCIAKDAPQKDLAHAFIDYILRPDVSAELTKETGFASPNAEAEALLGEDVRGNPTIHPPEDVLDRCKLLGPLDEATRAAQSKAWAEVKAR